MNTIDAILPGARVRTNDGLVGTVERLEYHDAVNPHEPTEMIVRSDDGHWRYTLPMMLVSAVTQGAFYTIVHVTISADELPYYVAEDLTPTGGSAPAPIPDGVWQPEDPDTVLRLPLAAEELTITKRPIELGSIHLHKGVKTVEQTVSVPLYHEEAIVEHIPPEQYDASVPPGPNEVIIPVVEEQLVVEKKTVVTEYLRVRKNVITDHQEVRDTMRQEFVEVTEQRRAPDGATDVPLMRERAASEDGAPVGTEA